MKTVLFNVVMTFTVITMSCGRPPAHSINENFVLNLAQTQPEEQIPILAWYGVQEHTVERYLELKASGITHDFTHILPNVDVVATALDAAEKAGIKIMFYCPELKNEPEETVKRFKDHPALAGYFLADEPGPGFFPQLGEWVRRVRAVDENHFCYANLLPNWAPQWALGTDNYREHVQLYIKDVPTQILSFDHYPVLAEPSGNRILRSEWYDNLEVFSDEARKAGKPFWAFALTVAHGPYPIPTRAEIRLQVYSNLAYGAQGIQYFTYWTPKVNNEDFHHAPIDCETGKRTEIYDYIKEINLEIKHLSSVFLNSQVISIAHTGENIPQGTKRLEKLPDIIKTFEVEGEGAIVSVLQKDGKSYLVVVNRDFKNNMKVKIEGEHGLQRILKDGIIVPASAYISDMAVDPGDVLIFCWNTGDD